VGAGPALHWMRLTHRTPVVVAQHRQVITT
jgi:hypothetical protein